jgi:SGNH domain-containing protein
LWHWLRVVPTHGLGVVLLSCITLKTGTPYPGTAALLPVLGTALVIGGDFAGRGAGWLLSMPPMPPMRAVGRVSYSWYLWHWPVDAIACSPPRSQAVNDAGIAAEKAATTANGGHYADLSPLFCTAQRCPVIVGNDLVFRDDNHVTIAYAQALAPVLGALADQALV